MDLQPEPVAPRRLESWRWAVADPEQDERCLQGQIYDDPPPRSEPDGTGMQLWRVAVESAFEGATVTTASGKEYLLGAAATSPRRALAGDGCAVLGGSSRAPV